MPYIPIENVGAFGIIEDMPDHDLPPEAWSAGRNVRFADGKVLKFQGEEDVFGTPSADPHFLLPWKLTTENRWIYADGTDIYYTNGSSHTYATRYTSSPGDDDYTGGTRPIWTGGILHGVPLLNHNNESDYPQQWDSSINRFKDLDNWPADHYCQVLRPFKNFVVALDITDSAGRYPTLVKWSHPADVGAVPSSWDETDATKLAGQYSMAQSGGFLIDCLPLDSSNIVYKSDAIWSMTPTGGLNVFRFNEIIGTEGILTARCAAGFKRNHVVVGSNDIYIFDGRTPQTLVDQRLRKWFYNTLSGDHFNKTIVVANHPKQEIWICFVEAGNTSEYLNLALVWKWTNNTWTIKELPETAYLAAGAINASGDTFNSSSGSFDTDFGAFGAAGVTPAELQLLHGKVYSSAAFIQGDSSYTSQGTAFNSYVERTGLAVAGVDRQGQPKSDPSKRKFLRGIFPKIESTVGVNLKISAGGQETPGGPVTWEPAQTFNSDTDTYVGCSVNAKYLAVKFEDEDGSVPWNLTGYVLDVELVGNL